MATGYEDIMKTTPYLPFDMGGQMTEAMIAKARQELGETEEVKAKTILKLRKLVQAEKGLVCPTDDAYLLLYLRARKYNVQRAFSLLKNFYEVKRSNGDILGSFDEGTLRRSFATKAGFMLPYRDAEGCAIAVVKMQNWDVDVTSASQVLFLTVAIGLWCAQEPATQVCGVRLLYDVRGTSLKQIRTIGPRLLYLFARAFTNYIPLRFKGFHLYNESPLFHGLISILKYFATEKLKKRIHLHGDNQEHLHEYIPKAILPAEDFGGDNPNDISDWFNVEVEKCIEVVRPLTTIYGYRQ